MAKTASDKPSASTEEALQRRKKRARREAKLMLEIEEAQKDLEKAQKKQSKAQARLEARSTSLHALEARLAELRAPGPRPAIDTPPQIAELEHQQEQPELESVVASSNGKQLASPETEPSTSIDEEQTPPFIEEATPSGVMVVTNEVTEAEAVQDNETATESDTAQTKTTPVKAKAQQTAAVRKSTATKRPASRSQSTRQPHADAE